MPDKNLTPASKIFTYFVSATVPLLVILATVLYLNPFNLLSNAFYLFASMVFAWAVLAFIFKNLLLKTLTPLERLNKVLEKLDFDQSPGSKKMTADQLNGLAEKLSGFISNLKTENQKLESRLKNQTADKIRLAQSISNLSDGLIALDSRKKVMVFNKAAQKLTQLTESEALGKEIKDVIKLSNKDGEISDLIYCPSENPSTNSIIFSEKNLQLSSQKLTKPSNVDLTTTKIQSITSPSLGCIITIHDTTQSKEFEDMKFDFVSMAAHELRTPITSIKGYISVLSQEMKDKIAPDQKMLFDQIQSSSERLASLVENLLNVSRIERGGLTINMQMLDWLELVKSIVNDHKARAGEKFITLEFVQPQTAIPQIRADRLRMGEVLSNLLSNAIKYTEPHGKVNVSIELNNKEVTTNVSDTGHGIPPEMQPYLFSKFFRVNNKLEYGTKGNGLGLYITKSIVELHHGKIWVKSELGKGSTFSFSLPL